MAIILDRKLYPELAQLAEAVLHGDTVKPELIKAAKPYLNHYFTLSKADIAAHRQEIKFGGATLPTQLDPVATCMHLAIFKRHHTWVAALVAADFNVNITEVAAHQNILFYAYLTYLHLAKVLPYIPNQKRQLRKQIASAMADAKTALMHIVNAKALNVNMPMSVNGQYFIGHLAVNDVLWHELFPILMKKGVDLSIIDSAGYTAYMHAICNNQPGIIDDLLGQDSKDDYIYQTRRNGDDPFSMACGLCVPKIVAKLIPYYDVNAFTMKSPLTAALMRDNAEQTHSIVTLLIEHGVDVNYTEGGYGGNTPLVMAAQCYAITHIHDVESNDFALKTFELILMHTHNKNPILAASGHDLCSTFRMQFDQTPSEETGRRRRLMTLVTKLASAAPQSEHVAKPLQEETVPVWFVNLFGHACLLGDTDMKQKAYYEVLDTLAISKSSMSLALYEKLRKKVLMVLLEVVLDSRVNAASVHKFYQTVKDIDLFKEHLVCLHSDYILFCCVEFIKGKAAGDVKPLTLAIEHLQKFSVEIMHANHDKAMLLSQYANLLLMLINLTVLAFDDLSTASLQKISSDLDVGSTVVKTLFPNIQLSIIDLQIRVYSRISLTAPLPGEVEQCEKYFSALQKRLDSQFDAAVFARQFYYAYYNAVHRLYTMANEAGKAELHDMLVHIVHQGAAAGLEKSLIKLPKLKIKNPPQLKGKTSSPAPVTVPALSSDLISTPSPGLSAVAGDVAATSTSSAAATQSLVCTSNMPARTDKVKVKTRPAHSQSFGAYANIAYASIQHELAEKHFTEADVKKLYAEQLPADALLKPIQHAGKPDMFWLALPAVYASNERTPVQKRFHDIFEHAYQIQGSAAQGFVLDKDKVTGQKAYRLKIGVNDERLLATIYTYGANQPILYFFSDAPRIHKDSFIPSPLVNLSKDTKTPTLSKHS